MFDKELIQSILRKIQKALETQDLYRLKTIQEKSNMAVKAMLVVMAEPNTP